MPKEIERKFLVKSDEWRSNISQTTFIKQAYIYTGPPIALRVRITDEKCTLNLKKAILETTRDEYEYEIPRNDAEELIEKFATGFPIEKYRHIIYYKGMKWEVDEFLGKNKGLILAEVEIPDPLISLDIPSWIGNEVSNDIRYLNSYLSLHPYSTW
ncbi:MAG: CYTH domain-containing protein [Candidatus Hydrogenedentes bacterium]|nr:CYTH domain-containing protein [Candidatus Hydrogenedentota bacterium]